MSMYMHEYKIKYFFFTRVGNQPILLNTVFASCSTVWLFVSVLGHFVKSAHLIIYWLGQRQYEDRYFRKWKASSSIIVNSLTLLVFLTMLTLVLLTLAIGAQAINLTVTSAIKYRATGFIGITPVLMGCDFGSDWAIMISTYNLSYSIIEYKIVANGSSSVGSLPAYYYTLKARGHDNNTLSNQTYFLINNQNRLTIYRSFSLSSSTRTQNNITDATFAASNSELYWIKNSKELQRYNVLNNSILSSVTLTGRNLVQVEYSNGWVAVYSQNNSNATQGFITIFNEQLSFLREFEVTYAQLVDSYLLGVNTYFKYNHSLDVHPANSLIMRAWGCVIQLWDTSASIASMRLFNTTRQVYAAVRCGAVAVVLYSNALAFYELDTWSLLASKSVSAFTVGHLKCLPQIAAVGLYFPLVSPTIVFYSMNITNATKNSSTSSSSNITQNSTQGNTTQNSSNTANTTNITNNGPVVSPAFNQSVVQSTSSELVSQLQQVFSSPTFTTGTQTLAKTMSIASSANVGSSLMRPLAYFFEQLLFYSYHRRVYPQLVEMICSQFDVLTYLRLNPTFLNLNVQLDYLTQADTFMKEQSDYLANRVPGSLYFTQTMTQLYLDNVVMAVTSYLIILLLAKLIHRLAESFPRLNRIHRFFYVRSIWWNLLIMVLSFNIRGFSYYSYAQLQLAYSLDFLSKLNLVFTIAMLALAFFFTFSFYFIVFRFQKPELSKQILEISKFSMQSYCMEMGLQCIRSFLQGFIHATLTRHHQSQVVGLLFIDILTLRFAFQFRSYFNNKLTFYLIFCYSVFFIVWEIFICLYAFDTLANFDYDFTFMVIVICLTVTAVLRMLYGILLQVIQIFKSICSKGINENNEEIILKEGGNKVCNLDLINYGDDQSNKQKQAKKQCSIQKQEENSKNFQIECRTSKTKKNIKIINKFEQPKCIEHRKRVKSDKQIPQYTRKKHRMQMEEAQTFKIIDLNKNLGHSRTDSRMELNTNTGIELASKLNFSSSQQNVAATSTSIKLRRNAVTAHHR